jgi:hypothetical protein
MFLHFCLPSFRVWGLVDGLAWHTSAGTRSDLHVDMLHTNFWMAQLLGRSVADCTREPALFRRAAAAAAVAAAVIACSAEASRASVHMH